MGRHLQPRRSSFHEVSCGEYSKILASRLYFSKVYQAVYILMILTTIGAILWTLGNQGKIPDSSIFIALEVSMSVLLTFEVVIRMLAQRHRFWHRWCNVFDAIVVILSLVSIAIYVKGESMFEELEEVATDCLLAIRNAIQYGRLMVFLRNRRLNTQPNDLDIDFDSIYIPEGEEHEVEQMLEEPNLTNDHPDQV